MLVLKWLRNQAATLILLFFTFFCILLNIVSFQLQPLMNNAWGICNNMPVFRIILSCILLSIASACVGQQHYSFNYNLESGLPSNHIYGVITDKNGYLWMASDRGVIRYNGYDFKVFNLSDGMPNEDIWELIEDGYGKIWLGNISDEYGYIYNNQYHRAYVPKPSVTVYPLGTRAIGDDVAFTSRSISRDGRMAICVEHNDTIMFASERKIDTTVNFSNIDSFEYLSRLITTDTLGLPIIMFDSSLYRIHIKQGAINAEKIVKADSLLFAMLHQDRGASSVSLQLNVITCFKGSHKLISRNIYTGKTKTISLDSLGIKDEIRYHEVDYQNTIYYLVTDHSILKFRCDNALEYLGTYPIDQLISGNKLSGNKVATIIWSDFWGKCICTETSGLWISDTVLNKFTKERRFDISDYRFVGGINDSVYFLWNKLEHKLAEIKRGFTIKYYEHKDINSVKRIVRYNSDTFLQVGTRNDFFATAHPETFIEYSKGILNTIASAAITYDRDIIFISTGLGFHRVNFASVKPDCQLIDFDRYEDLLFDSIRHAVWAYNSDKVFIHSPNKDTAISDEQLLNFGVRKVSRIVIDNTYGNAFIKGTTGINMYDPDKNTYVELFSNINLKGASVFIYHNLLIIAGQFGILFSKILGRQQISAPVIYPNLKNVNYSSVYECNAMFGQVFLNTDKGTFEVPMPADSEIVNSKPELSLFNCKFIVVYRDTVSNLRSGDTLNMDQNFRRLQFDIVNPYGNGKPKYLYRFANSALWSELNANELTLPARFIPDTYYILYLKVFDNVWRSDSITMRLYIRPLWWQTRGGHREVAAMEIMLVAVIISILVLVTRMIVLKAAKRRSLQMELELKAIYAQLNPHFIFNTLNSGLLMVKKNMMDEAYQHISIFSRLLRSYLRSSRNKLISIKEEVDNLRDYIELQQTRFKNLFEYIIVIDSALDQERTMIPCLLMQPFVENAINHGILPKKGNGLLTITFKIGNEKKEILCTIEDNGVGRERSRTIRAADADRYTSYGNILIKDLVNVFNKYEQMNIEIAYTDKQGPETGTIVSIKIKNTSHAP